MGVKFVFWSARSSFLYSGGVGQSGKLVRRKEGSEAMVRLLRVARLENKEMLSFEPHSFFQPSAFPRQSSKTLYFPQISTDQDQGPYKATLLLPLSSPASITHHHLLLTMSDYAKFDQLAVTLHPSGILHVAFNKPKKLNAVNEAVWRQYGAVFAQAGRDPQVLVIIVSGNGRAFCSGLDLASAQKDITQPPVSETGEELDAGRRAVRFLPFIKDFQNAIKASYTVNKPVIGVAHGVSYGLAIDILSNVDIRVAARNTRFSVREIAIGMAADIGSLQQLPRIIGNHSWLREAVYTGREFGADEALAQGFLSHVYDTPETALAEAFKLAEGIAKHSPLALYGVKNSLNYAIEHSLEEGLDQIAVFNSFALETDLKVGVMAALAKKPAKYSKL